MTARCWLCGRRRGPSPDGLGSHCRRKLATRTDPTPRSPVVSAAAQLELEEPMTDTTTADVPFVPPAAEGLPAGTLEAAEIGANRLDAWARTPHGRNFLAHALVQLARAGWLRTEPGESFEPVTDRPTPEPEPERTPCSLVPCEDGGEPCDRHEREQSHADGEHELCGPECTAGVDDAAMQVLSEQGAQCGDCGDEPGDRDCPACEKCRGWYVAALRKAGWAPRAEVLRARDEQFAAWLVKKARESANSRESTPDYLVRLADKVRRGAIR